MNQETTPQSEANGPQAMPEEIRLWINKLNLAWERDPHKRLPDVPVLQPRYDALKKSLKIAKAEIKKLRRSPAAAPEAEKDAKRLDKLQWALWNHPEIGNGIALFPGTNIHTKAKSVSLQGLGDEDGSDLGDELTPTCPDLRTAIDAMTVTRVR